MSVLLQNNTTEFVNPQKLSLPTELGENITVYPYVSPNICTDTYYISTDGRPFILKDQKLHEVETKGKDVVLQDVLGHKIIRRLHKVCFEAYTGLLVPNNAYVLHVDEDAQNNHINNLFCCSRSQAWTMKRLYDNGWGLPAKKLVATHFPSGDISYFNSIQAACKHLSYSKQTIRNAMKTKKTVKSKKKQHMYTFSLADD